MSYLYYIKGIRKNYYFHGKWNPNSEISKSWKIYVGTIFILILIVMRLGFFPFELAVKYSSGFLMPVMIFELNLIAVILVKGGRAIVFNATFNNISVISWQSVLLRRSLE